MVRVPRFGRCTLVYLDFKPVDDNHTEVTLRNFGYGQGEGWVKTKALARVAGRDE